MTVNAMTERENDVVAAVQRHAQENYNNDGWDYIVECMSSKDILDGVWENLAAVPGDDLDAAVAIKRIAYIARLLDDRRRNISATAF